jgi:L-amino acid N-acyltransferase YncA
MTGERASVTIRLAREADLEAINDIYNYFVLGSTCTYQEEPDTLDSRRAWFVTHGPSHPVTVAEADGHIVAWGALSRFRERSGYRHTVENAVYVHHSRHGQGIGSQVLADLIARARTAGHRTIVAGIDSKETASIGLHARFGFTQVAHLHEVGYKFNRWLDVIYMQRGTGLFSTDSAR